MTMEVREEPLSSLADYARVPIAFEVRTILDLLVLDGEKPAESHPNSPLSPRNEGGGVGGGASGLGGIVLAERAVQAPYVKDYDALDGGPAQWAARFGLSRWGLLAARDESRLIGGAALAFDTPGVDMLKGRRDLAVLWDIRVAPEARGHGVGAALFRAAEGWAAARGCRWLKVETQNVNVPACRFYARQGCVLGGIHRFAYPELPDEVQLLWYKELRSAGS